MALAALGLSSLAYGQSQKLTKPVLEQSLDYLQKGLLDNLGPIDHTTNQWNGWIPQECHKMATDNHFDPNHVSTYNVTYNDVRPFDYLGTSYQKIDSSISVIARGFSVDIRMPIQQVFLSFLLLET